MSLSHSASLFLKSPAPSLELSFHSNSFPQHSCVKHNSISPQPVILRASSFPNSLSLLNPWRPHSALWLLLDCKRVPHELSHLSPWILAFVFLNSSSHIIHSYLWLTISHRLEFPSSPWVDKYLRLNTPSPFPPSSCPLFSVSSIICLKPWDDLPQTSSSAFLWHCQSVAFNSRCSFFPF